MKKDEFEISMKNMEIFGDRYCEKYLDKFDKKKLETDWWYALKFFFGRSFARGRRDELSNEYYDFTIDVLEDHFDINGLNFSLEESFEKLKKERKYFDKESIKNFKKDRKLGSKGAIKHEDFNSEIKQKNLIVSLLVTKKEIEIYNKEISLANDMDLIMVLDVLNFISENDKKNIYNYLKNGLENRGVRAVYKELIEINGIGDKIATFIIRDIGLMNMAIINDEYEYAFPIDTWVFKIANKLNCNTNEVKKCLIDKCIKYSINPLKVAAGMWCVGSHSLDILLDDFLGKAEIYNVSYR